MKLVRLLRDPFGGMATTGRMLFGDHVLHTLERPWIPTDPGGKPSSSCVPAGLYSLIWHTRPSGDVVPCLVNPGLAVYHLPAERPNGVGRSLILCHSANWVTQIEGCIAPGVGKTVTDQGPMVTNSRQAMQILTDWLGDDEAHLLIEDAYPED